MMGLGIVLDYAECVLGLVSQLRQRWYLHGLVTISIPTSMPLDERLNFVWRELVPWFERLETCDVVGVEDQRRAQEGARTRGQIGHDTENLRIVAGTVRSLAWHGGCRVLRIEPQQAKRAVGVPDNATKTRVMRAVRALVHGCEGAVTEHAANGIATAIAACTRARIVRPT